jgi:aspartate aminotransferase-like enzyme
MDEDFLLLNPGPVPVTDEVAAAMDERMISHRSTEFEAIYERAQNGLDYIFEQSTVDRKTTEPPGGGTSLILNGTATMGMEAAVANLVGDGGNVVSLINGKFGRRFARIAERYAEVTRVSVPWGDSIPLEDVRAAVSDSTDLVTMVHNETSTGLLNPASGVGHIAAEHDARFVLDGVTSIGGDVFCLDAWHVDIAVTDAQKALAAPPGISAMYVAEDVIDELNGEIAPFYSDLEWHLRKAQSHQTPFTSAVPLFRALAVAIEDIVDETMATRIQRHRNQAEAFRRGFTRMGLSLFANPADLTVLSNTVTAVSLPETIAGEDAPAFFDAVSERNVSISGGQAHLGGEIFRVSNMGRLPDTAILRGVEAVGDALTDVGVDVDVTAGLAAARDQLDVAVAQSADD